MPSRRGLEQALTWLRSKMAEENTLDAINAEVCYNVILDLKKRKEVIGALFHNSNESRKLAQERVEEMRYELERRRDPRCAYPDIRDLCEAAEALSEKMGK